VTSALEVIFNEMRYINLRFIYLLTLLKETNASLVNNDVQYGSGKFTNAGSSTYYWINRQINVTKHKNETLKALKITVNY